MPFKDPEQQKRAQREYYERNKKLVYERSRAARLANRKWLEDQKRDKPCARCGNSYHPIAMDFHHRDGEKKERTVTNAIFMVGRQKVLEEIAKCELLCAVCHRLEHLNEGVSGSPPASGAGNLVGSNPTVQTRS